MESQTTEMIEMTENIFSVGNTIRWNNIDPTPDMYVTVLPYKNTDNETFREWWVRVKWPEKIGQSSYETVEFKLNFIKHDQDAIDAILQKKAAANDREFTKFNLTQRIAALGKKEEQKEEQKEESCIISFKSKTKSNSKKKSKTKTKSNSKKKSKTKTKSNSKTKSKTKTKSKSKTKNF